MYTQCVFSLSGAGAYVFCRMPNVILGCGETTTLMLLNSTHHCHYTMAPADSKFDDLSDADIDSLTEDAILKTPGKAANFNFSFKIVEVFLHVVNSFASFVQCIQFE